MNNPTRLEQMRKAMRSLACPGAAESIASILQGLASPMPSKDVSRD
jgi:UDP-N-acetylglucosamine:LPS N-acetylglucosamine transferase